jgi:hypothetical protein
MADFGFHTNLHIILLPGFSDITTNTSLSLKSPHKNYLFTYSIEKGISCYSTVLSK